MSGFASIDGVRVPIENGETVLDVARRAGRDIPTLCHVDGLRPEGGCRVCLVEVGAGNVVASCHTLATDGMDIRTESPALHDLRRDVLQLTCAAHPDAAALVEDDTPFARLLARFDLTPPARDTAPADLDESHPYMRFDRRRCIDCRQCLNVCNDVQGQFVYGIGGRGGRSHLIIGADDTFANSPCVACGACVDVCPTRAVTDRDRLDSTPAERTTRSICGYCGVGCVIEVETAHERVIRIDGAPDAEVNRGHLCVKGRYAHAYHHSSDRLTTPLRRDGDSFRPISWDEACDWLARRLREIREEHGPDALGVMTSSRSTNEAAYLLQRFFRTAIGTNNVDCCARVCHSSTALALQLVTGTGAASASYEDIERATCLVVAGANPTEAHPVVGARLKQAARRGVPLLVIDPRAIELTEYATLHLQLRAGTNVALFNAIAKVMIESGRFDRSYIETKTEGFGELAAHLAGVPLADLASITEVSIDDIERAAMILFEHRPALLVSGLGLSETTQGTASVMTYANLGMLTGSIGLPGAGMLPLRGQNNVQGNADMGGMPNQITGYQSINDPAVRARAKEIWGAELPDRAGLTIPEMLEAAAQGAIRALWIQGEDVAQSDPHQSRVIEALERLDLLVVQELFFSETARFAHLILPAAGALEQEGTFTNGERRIQHVRPAVRPPGDALPDWDIIQRVARAAGESWNFSSPAGVMDEIARLAPRLFGGVRYDRLGDNGLQWPCPAPDHPGTSTVHADGFLCGKGKLTTAAYVPSPEDSVDGMPYLLITGRVLDHYNVGTMTRRTPNHELVSEDLFEIHPADALREGIGDGAPVCVESRWGRTTVRATWSDRVNPGTLFLSFHYPETHANALVGPHLDPQSKCPGYKVTAVRVSSDAI